MKKYLVVSLAFVLLAPSVSFGAISFDSATADGNHYQAAINGYTFAHTVTTTANRIIFVGGFGSPSSDTITGVTYAGVAMTKISATSTAGPDNRYSSLWYLIAPTTGTNNVIITASGGDGTADAVSYAGACQTGQPDAYTLKNTAGTVSTSITTSLTTIADNSWTIIGARNERGGSSAGTGSVIRTNDTSGYGLYDSGGPVTPAGSKSMQISTALTTHFGVVMASFKPDTACPAATATRKLKGSGISR